MNKHCFRLVFSRVLGFLIPVAETTRAQRKSGQTAGPAPVSSTLLAVSVLLAGVPTWVAADILVDAANPSGTNVISAANGVPVVEIANPNSKGLSHNRFSEFDVKNPGLIFNNSLVNGQSQIGGALLRNPNLQRAATAILSEVTGNKPSSISGTLEVFGAKADLFIASPDGVTLNGVTTLNTSNLTVSTGHAKTGNGGLQFLVDATSGKVVIGADGVNTEGLSYFDIVARSVELQGKLGSDALQTDLTITVGQGTYDAVTGAFTAKPGDQHSGVAIAGSAAGAMHGRYINLISSDSGAGVRQDGLILAAKDIAISAAGDIQLTTTTAKGNVQIASSASFTNAGALEATTTQIKARDVLNQKGASLGGTNGLTIEADKSVTNKGGELIGSTVSVKADSIRNTGESKIVGTDIALTAQTDFTHDGKASIVAARNLSIDTGIFRATDGELLAGHNLTVAADSYQNSATIRSKNNASLTLENGNDLVVDRSFKGPTADALLVLSARDVTITDELNSAGSVAIKAVRDVRNQGSIIVGKILGITAKGLIDNQAGKLIWAGENLRLEAGTQLLNGLDSQILAMGDMSLSAGEKLQNNTGRIEAQKSVWIDAPVVENLSQGSGGLRPAGTAQESTLYSEKYGDVGEIQSFRTTITLPLYTSDLTVKQAVIKAGGDLLFNSNSAKDAVAKVRNVGGLIAATGNVLVEGDLENLGVSTTKDLIDILKEAQTRTRWTVTSDFVKNEDPVDGSLYDMLQRTFGGNYSDQWVNSLKNIKTPEVNELISAVLGADWKALNQKQLQPRWAAFKAGSKTKTYYADQQAEISAGKTFQHEGGSLTNGDGANAGGQRSITIRVGSETVKSLDGELNAQFDAKRADADKALKAQLDNPLFQRNQSGGAFGRIKPLYETRAKYLDQSQFLGSDYFLQKIGYDPSKTVSVLGDAYFDNQLILQNVEQRLGNFFAQTQRISGTDLAKQLLDNGAVLALKAGLTLGEPLSDKQIAGLEKDVVWYENREVDGQLVLAPRVYLSQKTLAARDKDAKSSALVGGDTVLIDANAVNNFNGTVRGNTDTFVYSKTDINNVSGGGAQAGFFAGQGGKNEKAGQLVIAAEGKVNNQGGVMSGYEQTVVGGKGISSSATTGYDKNGFLYVRDNGVFGTALSADTPKEETKASTEPAAIADTAKPADKDPQKVAAPDVRAIFDERLAAGPVDTTQGSSLNVISGGNINLTAAITQSDNVSLQTTGNLNLNDLHEARSAFSAVNKSGFLSNVQITEVGSSANSVGNTVNAKNLAIKTGGDLNITGGEINAQNSAIEVGGNSTIKAGKDLAFHEKITETTQLVIGGGVGAGGYEATGSWGTAPKVDTHLGAAFYGTDEGAAEATVGGPGSAQTPSIRGDVYAGRAANSQTLASNGTGARSGANKGRGATSGANFKVGLETVTTIDSSESATYRNAQLNLGNGSVKVGGTLDIGGADINSGYQLSPEERAKMTAEQRGAATDGMPTLAISAGDIKTTKVENTEKTRHVRDELFFGVTSEVHSSAIDIATQAGQLAHKAVGTDVVKDPNAPAGSSKTLATEDRKMDVDPALTAMAAVGLVTQAISGEVLGQSTTVGIKHTQQKSDSKTRSENINQLGGNISLTSTKGDIELNGVNLQGGKVNIKSAGNLTQRAAKSSTVSHDSTSTESVGLTTSIGVSATGVGAGISVGADGSGDKTTTTSTSYTNGLISGTEVSIETKGDHNLIGSNIKGNQVAVKVGGNQTITSVQDTSDMKHERNNWSASVGVAVTTNGLIQGTGSASASYGQDHDRSKLVAEQAGISADKLDLNVAGNLNLTGAHITSQKGQGAVQVGGKINAQTLHDSREKDGGYAGGGGGISKNGLASVTVEFGRVDQVHYNATNAATIDVGDPNKVTATKGISGPLNTNTEHQLNVTQNKRVAGTDVKVDFSAIADVKLAVGAVKKVFSPKTGGSVPTASKPTSRVLDGPSGQKTKPQLDAPKAAPNIYVDVFKPKPDVVGQGVVQKPATDRQDGPSLASDVNNLLLERGIKTPVKGYDTPISVNDSGRKQPAQKGAVDALANGDPAEAVQGESGQPLSLKKRWAQQHVEETRLASGTGEGAAQTSGLASAEPSRQDASPNAPPETSKRTAQAAQLSAAEPGGKKPSWDESANRLKQSLSGLEVQTLALAQQVSRRTEEAESAQVVPQLNQQGTASADNSAANVSARPKPQGDSDDEEGHQLMERPMLNPFNHAERSVIAATRQKVAELREARQSEAGKRDREQRNQARLEQYANESPEQRQDRLARQDNQDLQLLHDTPDWHDRKTRELRQQVPDKFLQRVEAPLSDAQKADRAVLQKKLDDVRANKLRESQQTVARPPQAVPADEQPAATPAKTKPAYDQYVIVNTDRNDPVISRAVENLAIKRGDKSVVLTPNADGTTTTVQGAFKPGGKVKVELVGHSDGLQLGGLAPAQLADVVQNLEKRAADNHTQLGEVVLVGCTTGCAKAGSSLVNEVGNRLLEGGTAAAIKGYDTAVRIDEKGRKQDGEGHPDALGKVDPPPPPRPAGEGEGQRPAPMSLKQRLLQAAAADGMLPQQPAPPPPPSGQSVATTSAVANPPPPGPSGSRDAGPSTLLGKRTATESGLDSVAGGDNRQLIQSALATIERELSTVRQLMHPAAEPVDQRSLPTFLWANEPATPTPVTPVMSTAGSAQQTAGPLAPGATTLPSRAWPDGQGARKSPPVAHVKGQPRAAENTDSSTPAPAPSDQRSSTDAAHTGTLLRSLLVDVAASGEPSKAPVAKRTLGDLPVPDDKAGLKASPKELLFDWYKLGGDITNTEDAVAYVKKRLPYGASPGRLRDTLKVMQEVAGGGTTREGKAVDEYWENLTIGYPAHVPGRAIAAKYGFTYGEFRSAVDVRKSMYDLFHPLPDNLRAIGAGSGFRYSALRPEGAGAIRQTSNLAQVVPALANQGERFSEYLTKQPIAEFSETAPVQTPAQSAVRDWLIQQSALRNRPIAPRPEGQPARDASANLPSVVASAERQGLPAMPLVRPDSKELTLAWVRSQGGVYDNAGFLNYARAKGGDMTTVSKTMNGVQQLFSKDGSAAAKATIEYFRLIKSGLAADRQEIARQYGVTPTAISMKMNRYRVFLEALVPAFDANEIAAITATSSVARSRPAPVQSVSEDVVPKLKGQELAINWVKKTGDVNDRRGLGQFVESFGGKKAGVTRVLGTMSAFVSTTPTTETKAAIEFYQSKETFKNSVLRAPSIPELAARYDLDPDALHGAINRYRPYVKVLLPLVGKSAAGEQAGGSKAPGDQHSEAPTLSPARRPVQPSGRVDDYVDVNNPSLISLEPRADSTSPVAAVDVDSWADDGFRTQVKREPPDRFSPEPLTPRNRQPEAMDVTDFDVGDATPWLKTEQPSPEAVAQVAEPLTPDAPVKEEVPVLRHSINNRAPILQDEHGRDILLEALQPPQKSLQTQDRGELLRRQKLTLGRVTELALAEQFGSPQAKRDVKKDIADSARQLTLLPPDDLVAHIDKWMEVDPAVPNKGRGVKAARDIPAYTVLVPYAGKLVVGAGNIESDARKVGMNFPNYLFGTDSDSKVISAFGDGVGNISSLFNHGDNDADNNMTVLKLGTKLIYFMTDRPVKAGEELQFDYGKNYDFSGWHNRPIGIAESEESSSETDTR